MKKFLALVLVVISLFSIAVPAFAATVSCMKCGAAATKTYRDEFVAGSETKDEVDGRYIRYIMRRPYTIRCNSDQNHIYDGYYEYYTNWELFYYWDK